MPPASRSARSAAAGSISIPKRMHATLESNAARANYIAHFGCKHLKVNLSQRVGPENLSAENGKILARNLNEVGKRTMDAGIKFAFHPHAWTLVERQPELDMVMELTDPKFVFLVLDTGHATLGGIDPLKALRDYYSARRLHPPEGRGSEIQHRARLARTGAERRRAQGTSICTSSWAAEASISRRSSPSCAGATTTGG